MANENKEGLSLIEKMKHTYYQIVVMNHDTFEEVGSYKLSLLSFYVLLSTIFVAVALLVVSIIVFTPIKRYIPGYEGGGSGSLLELSQRVEDLEKEVEARETYIKSFKRMMNGDVQTAEDMPKVDVKIPDSLLNVKRSQSDEQLRDQVASGNFIEEPSAPKGAAKTVNFSPRDVNPEQLYFIPPVTGEISMGFEPNKKHYGVDIIAPKNTPVKAVMDGFVIYSDWALETGNTIGIQHANNIVTFYKHNSVLLKKAGEKVKAGEAIAIIGNTGELTNGPHLHFELWQKGKPIDARDYIQF